MDEGRLAKAISAILDPALAVELAADFAKLRRDAATATLERASPGKFVETFIQCLQFMATGKFEARPRRCSRRDREFDEGGVRD